MKAIRCDLPCFEQIEIHPMADLHIGDSMSDFKLIMERIEHIKNTPNAYCILGGDLMDTAIANSVGDTYGANLKPMDQLKQCVKILNRSRSCAFSLAITKTGCTDLTVSTLQK